MPRGGLFHPPVPEMFSRRTRRAMFRVRKLTAPTVPGRPSARPASCPGLEAAMPRGGLFHPPVPETLSRRTRRAIFRVRKLTVPAIPGRPKRPSRVLSRPVTDLKPPCRAAARFARLCRKSFPAEHAGYIPRPEADGARCSRTPKRPSRVLSRPVTDLKPPCRAAARSTRPCRKRFLAEHAGLYSASGS